MLPREVCGCRSQQGWDREELFPGSGGRDNVFSLFTLAGQRQPVLK